MILGFFQPTSKNTVAMLFGLVLRLMASAEVCYPVDEIVPNAMFLALENWSFFYSYNLFQ